MTNGIYYYYDIEKNYVVYVGRDSYIDKKKRHKAHMSGKSQQFDKILQNNPDRYEYRVFCEGNFSNEELNDLEIQAIKLFNTHQREDAFNFTEGGEGIVGFEHLEETKKKMSEAHKGKKIPEETRKKISETLKGKNSGENNPMYGKKHPEETRKKMSEALKERKYSEETRKKMSEAHKKDYARVIKAGFNSNGKQRYALVYDEKKRIRSIYKEELEEVADRINKLENKDEETINQIIEEYKARKKTEERNAKKNEGG